MHPREDLFLSASLDNTVRFWDLRSNACQGMIRVKGKPQVAYDPDGLIFGVAAAPNVVKLFDARNYSAGPFVSFTPAPKAIAQLAYSQRPSLSTISLMENAQSLDWQSFKVSSLCFHCSSL
jgi:WD40 repeat protein